MSKKKLVIRFKNVQQLWGFAQKIHATNIEIITSTMTLICDCSDSDLELLSQFKGEIIEGSLPSHTQVSSQQFVNQVN
jgi:hypothetical protein